MIKDILITISILLILVVAYFAFWVLVFLLVGYVLYLVISAFHLESDNESLRI